MMPEALSMKLRATNLRQQAGINADKTAEARVAQPDADDRAAT